MSVLKSSRLFAVLIVLALATPLVAGPMRVTVYVPENVKISGKTLDSGSYDLEAHDAKVVFLQKGKAVAEAPIRWEEGKEKAEGNAVVSSSGEIKEIRFKGKTKIAMIQ